MQFRFRGMNGIVPRRSRDGHTIYFRSNRGGRWKLWKLARGGDAPQTVTSDDGMAGQESPDGKWLYFARGGESGIWRMPASGGEAQRILDQPAATYWAVGRKDIYFLSPSVTLSVGILSQEKSFLKGSPPDTPSLNSL